MVTILILTGEIHSILTLAILHSDMVLATEVFHIMVLAIPISWILMDMEDTMVIITDMATRVIILVFMEGIMEV